MKGPERRENGPTVREGEKWDSCAPTEEWVCHTPLGHVCKAKHEGLHVFSGMG